MIKVFLPHCGGGKQKEASGYGTDFSLGYMLWSARTAFHIILLLVFFLFFLMVISSTANTLKSVRAKDLRSAIKRPL